VTSFNYPNSYMNPSGNKPYVLQIQSKLISRSRVIKLTADEKQCREQEIVIKNFG